MYLLAIGIGGHPDLLPKALDEIAFTGKAAEISNLGNRQLGGSKEIRRAGELDLLGKAFGRLIGDPLKIGVQLGGTNVKFGCQLLFGQGFLGMLREILNHLKNIVVGGVEPKDGRGRQKRVGFVQNQEKQKARPDGILGCTVRGNQLRKA